MPLEILDKTGLEGTFYKDLKAGDSIMVDHEIYLVTNCKVGQKNQLSCVKLTDGTLVHFSGDTAVFMVNAKVYITKTYNRAE